MSDGISDMHRQQREVHLKAGRRHMTPCGLPAWRVTTTAVAANVTCEGECASVAAHQIARASRNCVAPPPRSSGTTASEGRARPKPGTIVTCVFSSSPHPIDDDGTRCLSPKVVAPAPVAGAVSGQGGEQA